MGVIDCATEHRERVSDILSPDFARGVFMSDRVSMNSQRSSYHGGAFFDAIGREFDSLERINDVISADVLDAWFPPSPAVIDVLQEHLSWAVGTSPPTESEGLTSRIARTRGVARESVIAGAGSSSLIFLALRHWLTRESRALVLDPSYGEYAHVLENVVRCSVDRLVLSRSDGYEVDLDRLEQRLRGRYDLIVIVNPNNPTGRHIPRQELEGVIRRASPETLFWIDETYVDYVDKSESIERFASESENVVVCKSMSKVYALSGLRVGYLCGPSSMIGPLRLFNPPWSVSLPGHLAAVTALQDPDYYSRRYLETHSLRTRLADDLTALGDTEITPGVANYLLCQLPADGPIAQKVIDRCRRDKLFLRDASVTSASLGPWSVRIAVKDATTNRRMVGILGRALKEGCG